MNVRKHCLSLAALLAALCSAASALSQFTEAHGGTGRVTGGGLGEAPQGGFVGIVLGNQSQMPAEVVQDLAALNQALPMPMRLNQVNFSHLNNQTGRSLAVQIDPAPGEALTDPLGVWIWPNWRDAGAVLHFDQYSEVRWLSNYHVWLMHRPNQGGWRSRVVDIRAPQQPFKFTGFKLETLRVADNGRWACVTNKGTLVVGRLDYNDEQWMTHVITVPVQEPIEDMLFLHQGTVLVVMRRPPQAESYALHSFVLSDEAAMPAMSMDGSCHSYLLTAQDQAFFGYVPAHEEIGLIQVTPQGMMTWQAAGYDKSHERAVSVSPSGKYAMTQRRDPFGGVVYTMRRTPLAAPADPLPEDPPTTTGSIWLSWAP